MIGDGQNLVDFTYVTNAAYAHVLAMEKLVDHKSVPAGEVYFITNGEPRPFWDFICTILDKTGCASPTKSVSFRIAYAFAYVMEMIVWLLSPFVRVRPTITRHMVCTMSCHHWFSHEKATRDLGYTPIVSLDEGIALTTSWAEQTLVQRDPSD